LTFQICFSGQLEAKVYQTVQTTQMLLWNTFKTSNKLNGIWL